MGQKVHPIGLRLGILRKWKSTWFCDTTNVINILYTNLNLSSILKTILLVKNQKALLFDYKIYKNANQKLYLFVFFYNKTAIKKKKRKKANSLKQLKTKNYFLKTNINDKSLYRALNKKKISYKKYFNLSFLKNHSKKLFEKSIFKKKKESAFLVHQIKIFFIHLKIELLKKEKNLILITKLKNKIILLLKYFYFLCITKKISQLQHKNYIFYKKQLNFYLNLIKKKAFYFKKTSFLSKFGAKDARIKTYNIKYFKQTYSFLKQNKNIKVSHFIFLFKKKRNLQLIKKTDNKKVSFLLNTWYSCFRYIKKSNLQQYLFKVFFWIKLFFQKKLHEKIHFFFSAQKFLVKKLENPNFKLKFEIFLKLFFIKIEHFFLNFFKTFEKINIFFKIIDDFFFEYLGNLFLNFSFNQNILIKYLNNVSLKKIKIHKAKNKPLKFNLIFLYKHFFFQKIFLKKKIGLLKKLLNKIIEIPAFINKNIKLKKSKILYRKSIFKYNLKNNLIKNNTIMEDLKKNVLSKKKDISFLFLKKKYIALFYHLFNKLNKKNKRLNIFLKKKKYFFSYLHNFEAKSLSLSKKKSIFNKIYLKKILNVLTKQDISIFFINVWSFKKFIYFDSLKKLSSKKKKEIKEKVYDLPEKIELLNKKKWNRLRFLGKDLVNVAYLSLFYKNINFLANFIGYQMTLLPKNRTQTYFLKYVVKTIFTWKGQYPEILGLKIQFKGRFNKWRRTKKWGVLVGSILLQSYNTNIEYAYTQGLVRKGIFSIRIWLQYKTTFITAFKENLIKYFKYSSSKKN